MAGMSRDSATVELGAEPEFNYGDKVRSRKHVKNDGTFTGAEIGEVIVTKGDVGFIISIGTYLQQFYIYGVCLLSGRARPESPYDYPRSRHW